MAVEIPGLSLSILRQDTRVQTGRPLLISGRFTAFGLGVPALIRVTLEGPSYDPQTRTFDTFASPFSGDYSTNVVTEKGGSYEVYAQAFPPPLIPTGPPFPEAILLLPPMAESTHPPLAIGQFTDGGVDFTLPDGTSQFMQTPAMAPIEFRPVISVGAPGVTVTIPGVGGVPVVGIAPTVPAAPAAPGVPVEVPTEAVNAVVENITMSPSTINPGQAATGVMSWRNTSASRRSFDAALYLIDSVGARHGPLQVTADLSASPQIPQITNVRMSTSGLPSGTYSVQAELYDSVTGSLVDFQSAPYALEIQEIAPPAPAPPAVPAPPEIPEVPVPEVPEIPTPAPVVPEVPTVPTADILGQPTLNLSRQLRVGDTWSGSVSLPTYGLAPYYLAAQLILESPTGQRFSVADAGRIVQAGEPLNIPVNLNTSNLSPGDYAILLRVADQFGAQLFEFPLGFLSLLEAIVELPPAPEAPTLPTADMIQTPFVVLPLTVTLGEVWQGNISVPTTWPATLPQVPSIPSYNFGAGLQLEAPTGQRFNVTSISNAFTPGRPINIPVNFDTGVLPQAGNYNMLLKITDFQGREIFDNIVGILGVLPAPPELAPPPEVPEVPVASEFPAIAVNIGVSEVEAGDTLSVPVSYTHVGAEEVVTLYAAIGNYGFAGFDEVLHGSKQVTVPLDATPRVRNDTVNIRITERLSPGVYDVYAKITGRTPEAISAPVQNVIRMIAPPAPPAPPAPSQFTAISVNISRQQVEPGDVVRVPVSVTHVGAAATVRLYAAIGNYGAFGFDEILHGAESYSVPMDATPTARGEEIDIRITEALSPGTYDVYAKVTGIIPEVISSPVQNVIEYVAPPELPPSNFPGCTVVIGRQRVKVGDTVNVPVYFSHIGGKERIRIYAAIGNYGRFGFDEILHGEMDWSVPDEMDQRTRTVTVSIPITSAISPGTYDVYGTVRRIQTGLGEIISDPVQNVIEVYQEAAVVPSQYSNISISAAPILTTRGATLAALVTFTHQGEAENEWLYGAIGNSGAFGFDEILSGRAAISVNRDPSPRQYQEFIQIPITSAISPGTYDMYVKIGLGARPKAISQTYRGKVIVQG